MTRQFLCNKFFLVNKLLRNGLNIDTFHVGSLFPTQLLKLCVFEKDHDKQVEPRYLLQKGELALQTVRTFKVAEEYDQTSLLQCFSGNVIKQLEVRFQLAGLLLI